MKIYLLGICGTGMASLAGMLKSQGHQVLGSDQNTYPPMSTLLQSMGIPILTPYDATHLNERPDLAIVGNVISRGNPEAEVLLSQDIPYLSMPQALGKFFLPNKRSLVVAGTHGKTTTSSLLSWVLESAGREPSFFIGGIPKNFGNNFKLGEGQDFILEGDEYDTAFFDKGPKFLHYQAQHVLLTSIEFDHADIYRDLEHVKDSFRKLLQLIPSQGSLIANLDFPEVKNLSTEYLGKLSTYTLQEKLKNEADYFAEITRAEGNISFRVSSREQGKFESHEFSWKIPGRHNVSNALGVIALTRQLGLTWEQIAQGIQSFQGVKRRQDVLAVIDDVTVIDDFAHHPTAVFETVAAIRRQYPQKRLWAIFEPRSNSSKRDVFQKDYPKSFSEADRVIIADVFMPEKVKDGHVLNVDAIVESINHEASFAKARHISGVDTIVEILLQESQTGDVLLLMSNGGFGGIHQKLLEALEKKN